MVANRRKSAREAREMLLESSHDLLVVDSKSKLESSLSDFKVTDDDDKCTGTMIYDVRLGLLGVINSLVNPKTLLHLIYSVPLTFHTTFLLFSGFGRWHCVWLQ